MAWGCLRHYHEIHRVQRHGSHTSLKPQRPDDKAGVYGLTLPSAFAKVRNRIRISGIDTTPTMIWSKRNRRRRLVPFRTSPLDLEAPLRKSRDVFAVGENLIFYSLLHANPWKIHLSWADEVSPNLS